MPAVALPRARSMPEVGRLFFGTGASDVHENRGDGGCALDVLWLHEPLARGSLGEARPRLDGTVVGRADFGGGTGATGGMSSPRAAWLKMVIVDCLPTLTGSRSCRELLK